MSDGAPFSGLVESLKIQATICERMGSPFSGALLSLAAEDVIAGGQTRQAMGRWAGSSTRLLFEEAAPIRLLGALHYRALSGEEPELAAAYPKAGHAGDPAAAWRAALETMTTSPEPIERFLDHEPQTNEVRRSACLLPGLLETARVTGLPIRTFELGASAGLNQLLDRYRYDFGDAGKWGPLEARVVIPSEWRGPPPPLDAELGIVERSACDRKPVDLSDATARRRLRAFVWADQFDRLERLDAAVALAQEVGTRVEAEDALAWTKRRVAPATGVATVILHSVFWQYMPAETQQALAAAIPGIGGAATTEAPLAWLRMEPPPTNMAIMELRLTLWPGGEDCCLAHVHPHGAWVEWLA